jgi:adenylate kinase family enzyme
MSEKIIHILAEPGSGKTTLGKKLQKHSNKFAVIELDDIDDPIGLKMLNESKYLKLISSNKHSDHKKFFKEKDKKGIIEINKLIKKYQKEDKIIIITGLSIDIKKIPITDKYFIDIDPKQLFKQLNLRTLGDIVKYNKEIEKLIKTEAPEKVNQILLYKYKLRAPFLADYSDVKRFLENRIKKNKKYKLMTFDKIYGEIINFL